MKSLKEKANYLLKALIKTYPDAKIALEYKKNDPWQLLVVVALSAQTTDKKVNEISPALFEQFKNIKDFAKATPKEIEPFIKTLGLYKGKAKNLHLAAKKILEEFDGKVPSNRKQLESIPGVGSKTAAVILSNGFNIPAIAVDTHVGRVSRRLGLTQNHNPEKVEKDLCALWPKSKWISAHHTLILHGRNICLARKPKCAICPLDTICPKIGV